MAQEPLRRAHLRPRHAWHGWVRSDPEHTTDSAYRRTSAPRHCSHRFGLRFGPSGRARRGVRRPRRQTIRLSRSAAGGHEAGVMARCLLEKHTDERSRREEVSMIRATELSGRAVVDIDAAEKV